MSMVRTPGGRIGDDRSIGSRSNGENWVERAGGMPRYMRIVRNGLMRERGMSKGKATAFAVAAIKRWAAGGEDVSPKVRAAAAAALAEWEKMKATTGKKDAWDELELKGEHDLLFFDKRSTPLVVGRGKPPTDNSNYTEKYGKMTKRRAATEEEEATIRRGDWVQVDEHGNKPTSDKYKKTRYRPALVKKSDGTIEEAWIVSDAEFKHDVPDTLLQELHDHINTTTEVKDTGMKLETKQQAIAVGGLNVIDEKQGIVEAFVSVTGLRDNVKDVINPGAYEKTLITRTPKGVYAHKWDMPISKALEVKELLPGDPELPQTLPNKEPWPAGAGALKVKAQFNMGTQRGRDAFSDVVFYGDEQEWSIGYQVPAGGARLDQKTGVRYIDYLELYEFSPVLFGAMPAARTSSVKDALAETDFTVMTETEFKSFLIEHGLEVMTDEEKGMWCMDEDCDGKCGLRHPTEKKADPDSDEDEQKGHPIDRGHRSDSGYGQDDLFSEEDDEDDDAEEKALSFDPSAYEYDVLVKAYAAIGAAIEAADAAYYNQKSVSEVIQKNAQALGQFAEEMKEAAEAFDTAYDLDDVEGMNDFGEQVLEVLEKALETATEAGDNGGVGAAHKVAAAIASMAPRDEDDLDTPEEDEDEDDTSKKSGAVPLPPKPGREQKEDADLSVIEVKELEALRVGFKTLMGR